MNSILNDVVDSHCNHINCIYYDDGCRQFLKCNCPKCQDYDQPKSSNNNYIDDELYHGVDYEDF